MWRCAPAVVVLLSSVAILGGCGGSAGRSEQQRARGAAAATWTDPAARVSAAVPPGWHVTARPLTGVVMPVQRLVVTSFRLRGHAIAHGCSPAVALRQMPADGAMVYVMEYRGPTPALLARFAPRPSRFRLTPATLGDHECLGRCYLIAFRDHGRALQAHVYLGRRATPRTRRRALAVLDSMRFGRMSPFGAAVWVSPHRLLARAPYLGVACPRPNRFACDRVGLAVWLRDGAEAVSATIDGRPVALDDAAWSGPAHSGRRRMFAGFLRPAGLRHGPLALRADDGRGRWIGRRPVRAGVGLTIRRSGSSYVRTSLVVRLAPGWG